MDKRALLTTIDQTYAELDALLAQLDPAAMTTPDAADGWSIKDILAHISFWQQRMCRQIEAALRGERLARPITALEAGLLPGADWMDQLNARAVAAQRERPLPEVLQDFRSSHQRTVALVGSIPTATLAAPSAIDAVLDGSLIELIAGDTFEHYQEHIPTIRAWLERSSRPADS